MIHPTCPTTAQQLAAANARLLLESEPRPAFDLATYNIYCINPEAMDGQRNYIVQFERNDGNVHSFDGRHWENFPV